MVYRTYNYEMSLSSDGSNFRAFFLKFPVQFAPKQRYAILLDDGLRWVVQGREYLSEC